MATAAAPGGGSGGGEQPSVAFNVDAWRRWSFRMSRRLSSLADESVENPVGEKYSRGTAIVIALNMTLGTGPLTLPFAFAQAGLLLGAFFLAICAAVGYITTTYIIETLALENAVIFETAELSLLRGLLPAEEEDSPLAGEFDIKRESSSLRKIKPDKVFKIRERIEIGEMGNRILPTPLHELLYILLFLYTFGCLCVYSVALASSVEALLPASLVAHLPAGFDLHGCVILGLAAVLFPLCFADMQKLRSLQWVIMGLRVLAILAMIMGAIYEVVWPSGRLRDSGLEEERSSAWVWRGMPMADLDGLPSLFANAVLAFMVHHSLPGLLSPLENKEDAPRAVASAYGVAYLVYIVLGSSAVAAFGRGVPALYNLAFRGVPVAGGFLIGYPLMLLAIYPIVGITFRNNLLSIVCRGSAKERAKWKDAVGTAVAALPPLGVAYLTSNVQSIVSIFAGYFGLSLMLLMPSLLVVSARRKIDAATPANPLRSRWASPVLVSLVVLAWALAIAFNTYRLFFV